MVSKINREVADEERKHRRDKQPALRGRDFTVK